MGGLGVLLAASILPVLLVAATLFWWDFEMEGEGRHNAVILSAARANGVPRELIKAVIWRESRFDASAHGLADERGLMQVTPRAGADWARANQIARFHPDSLFDPHTNIHAGTWYLGRALRRWSSADRPVPFALAEYNAGLVHARRWAEGMDPLQAEAFIERVDFPTTVRYIRDVEERMEFYRLSPSADPLTFLKDRIATMLRTLTRRQVGSAAE